MSDIEQIGQGRNVSLTTFRRDGRSVATALWFVVDRGELSVLTAPDSGKVKRIRTNDRVVIAPCDSAGRITQGAPSAEGTARLLDEPETARVHKLMARKYVAVRLAHWWDRLRFRRRPWIGITVTL
jgi:PPOX class probable F420-dependent enzyme